MRKNILILWTFALLLLCSCATPNVSYFNDLENGQTEKLLKTMDIRLRPDDKISIVVKSKDPLLADLFNLPIYSHRVGYSQAALTNTSQQMSVYTVDKDGVKRLLAHLLHRGEYHSRYPEEDYVVACNQNACWVEIVKLGCFFRPTES